MAKTVLNRINALATAHKGDIEKDLTPLHHLAQKPALFEGFERTYEPLKDGGQQFPAERKLVQQKAADLIAEAVKIWTRVWDLTLTQDAGNQHAVADVVVDGKALLAGVPVGTLLFLDKQLQDVATFVNKLPTPAPEHLWDHDANSGLLRARHDSKSIKTTKEQEVLVKYPHSEHHPAQAEIITRDVIAGTWTGAAFSGAMPADQKAAMLARVRKLQDAVKVAKEVANATEVERREAGDALLGYVFGG